MTYVLGLNAFHGDSSACLLHDGRLVAAAEEERFRRIKHWAGFPALAVRYCLEEAGIDLQAVQHVAVNQDSTANLWRKLGFALATRPDPGMILERLRNKKERAGVDTHLAAAFPDQRFAGEIHHIEHHAAHLASSYLVSPFERAVAVSVDGFGDFASAAWGLGEGERLRIDDRIYFPHSLGIFYEAMTQYLGFRQYGDEYKVMGLASYGVPKYLDDMRRIVQLRDDGTFRLDLEFFRHHREKVEYQWQDCAPVVGDLYSDALIDLLGPARDSADEITQEHRDIARSAQAMYEEALFGLLDNLHRRYSCDALALAGGCAMNSVANGKICRETGFKRLYMQPAAGDAGGAIGAAVLAWQAMQPSRDSAPRAFEMHHAYWGPSYSRDDVADIIEQCSGDLARQGCTVAEHATESGLLTMTAEAIAEGRVVGWFQGRMEWGPRALGNRSILADPRRADIRDILNLKIKRRESFRPFAPSILREAVRDWFEVEDDVPFMMQVLPVRAHKKSIIPAVTHVDGSGRLQTVHRSTNQRYYDLIARFAEISGVPMLVNTSFNENEPVVCRPQEALDCFLRTRMDILVVGDFFISRHA